MLSSSAGGTLKHIKRGEGELYNTIFSTDATFLYLEAFILDEFLDAIYDGKVTHVIDNTHIACMEVAFVIDTVSGRSRILDIACHDVGTLAPEFASLIHAYLCQAKEGSDLQGLCSFLSLPWPSSLIILIDMLGANIPQEPKSKKGVYE